MVDVRSVVGLFNVGGGLSTVVIDALLAVGVESNSRMF